MKADRIWSFYLASNWRKLMLGHELRKIRDEKKKSKTIKSRDHCLLTDFLHVRMKNVLFRQLVFLFVILLAFTRSCFQDLTLPQISSHKYIHLMMWNFLWWLLLLWLFHCLSQIRGFYQYTIFLTVCGFSRYFNPNSIS